MTFIENIFVCLALPLILSLLFTRGRARSFPLFVVAGMSVCLLSAYVSSFFMGYCGADARVAVIEITPVCEEILKLLPLLFYLLIFEPKPRELPGAALAIAVGFATFENVCYLTENGAEDLAFLLIRGISAGALHILCGVLSGYGIAYVFRRRWLALTGTVGILGACIGFHGIYNLLITAQGVWKTAGYLFPSVLLVCLLVLRQLLPRLKLSFA
ncbi:MAG: PrsW family intramembrane metalloprotease [Clostridiales bacterium]|nr:PrsW family intramembrane metalloprotease [Clostridiales bacterium]MDY4541555.1 PrsW family glutamic-type intramembrane protease [Candidatus Ventricola sp.]